jgi:hypothetical protein
MSGLLPLVHGLERRGQIDDRRHPDRQAARTGKAGDRARRRRGADAPLERSGFRLKNFTGIDDPYEPPLGPEIRIDTVGSTAEENAELILSYLAEQGFVPPSPVQEEHEAGGDDSPEHNYAEAEGRPDVTT